jgi:hypothetical protein
MIRQGDMIVALALALVVPAPRQAPNATLQRSSVPNPRAIEFLDRNAAVRAWALRGYDANHDGWLTSFEAQAALDAFRDIADRDRDGHVTVREYEGAVALVRARP